MQDPERQSAWEEKASFHEQMPAQAGESPREKLHNRKQTRKKTRGTNQETRGAGTGQRVDGNQPEWGNNMGLQCVQAKLAKGRCADGETVETGLMWDRCGEEAQEHGREAEHWEHRWAGRVRTWHQEYNH